jgi:large subunit ribosomal protein L15
MQLHELKPVQKREVKRRIGRGGKRGSYSGRGVKGQKSRAGRRIRPAVRDLLIRIPKRRGFHNNPKSEKPLVVNLSLLERKLKPLHSGAALIVDRTVLDQAGIVLKKYDGNVKVLGGGDITFPIAVRGLAVSAPARKKIEAAGGSVN